MRFGALELAIVLLLALSPSTACRKQLDAELSLEQIADSETRIVFFTLGDPDDETTTIYAADPAEPFLLPVLFEGREGAHIEAVTYPFTPEALQVRLGRIEVLPDQNERELPLSRRRVWRAALRTGALSGLP